MVFFVAAAVKNFPRSETFETTAARFEQTCINFCSALEQGSTRIPTTPRALSDT